MVPQAGWAVVGVPALVTHVSGTLAGSAGLLFSSHVVLDHFHNSVLQDSENSKVVAGAPRVRVPRHSCGTHKACKPPKSEYGCHFPVVKQVARDRPDAGKEN